MCGRDPHERHRVATPLELLFDLTFVIAFGVAASEFAHMLVAGHIGAALTGFVFATFAVILAWINFTWFASAYDTDDWIYRVMTMVQMVGVLILALGIHPFFASIEHGDHVDNAILVAGYVVMRIALVGQWLRAARQDPAHRTACLTYAVIITVAQLGLDRDDLPTDAGSRDAGRLGGARHHRVALPADCGIPQRDLDTVARAPHRRALWPTGDHRPR